MQIDLLKYLKITRELLEQTGFWVDPPKAPFEFVIDKRTNTICEIRVRKNVINSRENYKLKYSEEGTITGSIYKVKTHSYHFEGRTASNGAEKLKPFRIDLDRYGDLHANHDDSDETIPHRLKYPDHINLNIINYSLPLMIASSNEYINSHDYPLDNDFADKYNTIQDKVKGAIKYE